MDTSQTEDTAGLADIPLRVGLLLALLVSSALSTALPVLVSIKCFKGVTKEPAWRVFLLSFLNCFAGGVFLGVTFLHLLPDVSDSWSRLLKELDYRYRHYPFGNFLVVIGFFIILVIEQFAHTFQSAPQAQDPGGGGGAVQEDSPVLHQHHHTIRRYNSQPNILASIQVEQSVVALVPDPAAYHSDVSGGGGGEGRHRRHVRSLEYNRVPYKLPTSPLSNGSPGDDVTAAAVTTHEKQALLVPSDGVESPFAPPRDNPSSSSSSSSAAAAEEGPGKAGLADRKQGTLRAVFLAVALSVHSVFEGLAFGLIKNEAVAIDVFIGVIIHKTVIGVSLGIAFVSSRSGVCLSMLLTVIFVLSSPVGIAVGLGVHAHTGDSFASQLTSAVLVAIACGTFTYITFLELIGHEFSNVHSCNLRHRMLLVASCLLGCSLMAGLSFLPHA